MESEKTLQDLGWPHILAAWASRCGTARGSASVLSLAPCTNHVEAEVRAQEIDEARHLENRAHPMSFGGITDVRSSVIRAQKGSRIEPDELVAVADCARGYQNLRDQLKTHDELVPRLWERALPIGDFHDLTTTLYRAFEPDGRISDNASSALAALRRNVRGLQQSLETKAKSLLEDSRIVSELQDQYWTQRDNRYVLPVKASSRSKVPGIVHGSSGSGQTVFVEPHILIELNNDLKLAELAVRGEELRILVALSADVGNQAEALTRAGNLVVDLDRIGGAAKLATHLRAEKPVFCDSDRQINLRNAHHPLMLLANKKCVPNDIVIDNGHILMISGPNAGGKTVVLKTTGLAILMSRYGLHIAAGEGSRIPWFDEVLSAIGDSQSLESELSTFSAHLTVLKEFIDIAGPRSLVLIDEICSATEPEQGGALAQAFLEALVKQGVTALVTTHYEALKALAMNDKHFANASVGFNLDLMEPTFHLYLGIPGASAAIDVARRMNVPTDITRRAQELSGGHRTKLDELLRVVSDEKTKLHDERKALEEERAATAMEYERITSERAAEESRAQNAHIQDYDQAMQALRAARRELETTKTLIRKRKRGDSASLQKQKTAIDSLSTAIAQNAPKRPAPAGKQPLAHELLVGTKIFVTSLSSHGVVIESAKRGKAKVQIGTITSLVALNDLRFVPSTNHQSPRHPPTPHRQASYQLTRHNPEPQERHRTPDSTLDIRGERVVEAIAQVDQFIDASLLNSHETVFIVHGHGTGALRAAIRSHLQTHAGISSWSPGERDEGGDGVTVAWFTQ